jgi:hypothetical protein
MTRAGRALAAVAVAVVMALVAPGWSAAADTGRQPGSCAGSPFQQAGCQGANRPGQPPLSPGQAALGPPTDQTTPGVDPCLNQVGADRARCESGVVAAGTQRMIQAGLNRPGAAVQGALDDAAGQALRSLTVLMVGSAVWIMGEAQATVDNVTTPNVLGPEFVSAYRIIFAVAITFLALFLLAAIVEAVLRSAPVIAFRAAFVYLPLAVLGSIVLLNLVAWLLALTDDLSAWMTGAASGVNLDPASFAQVQNAFRAAGDALAASGQSSQTNLPVAVLLLAALLAIGSSALVWLELILREAAIYIAVLFIPLAAVGLVWPQTQRWLRRLLETIFALVISKLLIVGVMVLGVSVFEQAFQFSSGGSSDPGVQSGQLLGAILAGVAIFLLAAYMPYKVLRMIPVGIDGAIHHMYDLEGVGHGASRRVKDPSGGMAQGNEQQYIMQLAKAPQVAVPLWAAKAGAAAWNAAGNRFGAAAGDDQQGGGRSQDGGRPTPPPPPGRPAAPAGGGTAGGPPPGRRAPSPPPPAPEPETG